MLPASTAAVYLQAVGFDVVHVCCRSTVERRRMMSLVSSLTLQVMRASPRWCIQNRKGTNQSPGW